MQEIFASRVYIISYLQNFFFYILLAFKISKIALFIKSAAQLLKRDEIIAVSKVFFPDFHHTISVTLIFLIVRILSLATDFGTLSKLYEEKFNLHLGAYETHFVVIHHICFYTSNNDLDGTGFSNLRNRFFATSKGQEKYS